MFYMERIVGLSVVSIHAFELDKRRKRGLEPRFILFSDGQTLMELEEQDTYAYHDCSHSARNIGVYKDKRRWSIIKENKEGHYPLANSDL